MGVGGGGPPTLVKVTRGFIKKNGTAPPVLMGDDDEKR